MEVEHEAEARLLDALAKDFYVFQVLYGTFFPVRCGCFRRVYKQTDAHGIPSLLFEKSKRFDGVTVLVFVDGSFVLELLEHGNVAAHEFLR